MPLNQNIKKVVIIGSGPIIVGQAAEFDYSGTQAIKSLTEEGVEVVLVNSNPATIMTDKELCSKVYMEPMTEEYLERVLLIEKPDSVLANLGGQTALNLALKLSKSGFLEKRNINLLGVNLKTIEQAEDREKFKELALSLNEFVPTSLTINSVEEAIKFSKKEGFPLIIRPAFTMGGEGGGIVHNEKELKTTVERGLALSPISQVLLEISIAGFKEIEFEVMRDRKDNCVIICSMENFDPVGVHTGDSIVVAPCQTLNDRDYQRLRNVSLKLVSALKIEGGCNVQLALDPKSEKYFIIEVNPRVSRSSALASKATGYPIAKIAAKIALGYSLDEIKNPITKNSSACFEPALDYIVTKLPKFPFDQIEFTDQELGSSMKAIGEVMAIGKNFESSFLKALRSLEDKNFYLEDSIISQMSTDNILKNLSTITEKRIFYIAELVRRNISPLEIHEITTVDTWFLEKIQNIIKIENSLKENFSYETLLKSKNFGFSDSIISKLTSKSISEIRSYNLTNSYQMIDTCAGEFACSTPYLYSSFYEKPHIELAPTKNEKVIILGSGPIRIGQGVEFDYSTVHAVKASQDMGYEAIVINCNPETVSTDFSVADRLYFEPLFIDDVLEIIQLEKPMGVICQFGGQTALNLMNQLQENDVQILGTSKDSIDLCEDRKRFENFLNENSFKTPRGFSTTSSVEAFEVSQKLGFPLMIRPSYVTGGKDMAIIHDQKTLESYTQKLHTEKAIDQIFVDEYLVGKEFEVDAVCDGEKVFIPGIMEHLDRSGIHSGDSFAVYPAQSLTETEIQDLTNITTKLALKLKIVGFINIQFIRYKNEFYIIEANPRSSRTVPFISKGTNQNLASLATKSILGQSLKVEGPLKEQKRIYIKSPVFSFQKLKGADSSLGPSMKSTGEAIGIDESFHLALKKSFEASGIKIPSFGKVIFTISDKYKEETFDLAKDLSDSGFDLLATSGTHHFLSEKGIQCSKIKKGESEGELVDLIKKGEISIIINGISKGESNISDGHKMRRAAIDSSTICLTSLDTARSFVSVIKEQSLKVSSL